MRLALAFGVPLAVLDNVLTSEELTLWEAFNEYDPISLHQRIDLAAGVVASANINKSLKPGSEPTKPTDFMPVLLHQENELKKEQQKQENKEGKIDTKGLRAFFRGIIRNRS